MNQVTNVFKAAYAGVVGFAHSSKQLVTHPRQMGALVSRTCSAALKALALVPVYAKAAAQGAFSLCGRFLKHGKDLLVAGQKGICSVKPLQLFGEARKGLQAALTLPSTFFAR